MDEQAIFITGPPGVGKSSCLERLARDCDDLLIDGVISGEMRRDGKRAGFEMRLISSGASGVLASPDIESEIRFGTLRESDGEPRLGVSHDFLRDIVCPHLRAVAGKADLIVVDEIGAMQATCAEFRAVVGELIAARTRLLASVSLSEDPWISGLRASIPTVELTRSNRELLTEMLTTHASRWAAPDGGS